METAKKIKRTVLRTLPVISLAILLSRCGLVAPSCDDTVVLELVDQIIRSELLDSMTNLKANPYATEVDYQTMRSSHENNNRQLSERIAEAQRELDAMEATDNSQEFEMAKNDLESLMYRLSNTNTQIAELDELVRISEAANISVSMIRTQGVDAQTSRTTCLCQIGIDSEESIFNSEINISYTAQYTDDGENVYVEIQYL